MFGEHERQREHIEREREAAERQREANERQHEMTERREDRIIERHEDHAVVVDRAPHEYIDRSMDVSNSSPTFHPVRAVKILISPGEGAGWITYAPRGSSDEFLAWMITYEPLIRGLERGARKANWWGDCPDRLEEIIQDFHKEARTRHHVERGIVTARAGDIQVREVHEPFEVRETDGRERIEYVGLSRRRVIRLS